MKLEEIITDAALDFAWQNANFGDVSKRDVIKEALLKAACGYSSGSTARAITMELGLTERGHSEPMQLTRLGKEYLWTAFAKS